MGRSRNKNRNKNNNNQQVNEEEVVTPPENGVDDGQPAEEQVPLPDEFNNEPPAEEQDLLDNEPPAEEQVPLPDEPPAEEQVVAPVEETVPEEQDLLDNEPPAEEIDNARQEDIIENYEHPQGEGEVVVPDGYELGNSELAADLIGKVEEFKAITDTKPFPPNTSKVEIKYHISTIVDQLLKDPEGMEVAIVNLAAREDLLVYLTAMGQLTNQVAWKYNSSLLIKVDIFLNLVTLYNYKLKDIDMSATRPSKPTFETMMFKNGASRAVAKTIAKLLY